MCDLAGSRGGEGACATSPAVGGVRGHVQPRRQQGGVRGVSPRQPSRLPASAADEQYVRCARFRRRRTMSSFVGGSSPDDPCLCPLPPQTNNPFSLPLPPQTNNVFVRWGVSPRRPLLVPASATDEHPLLAPASAADEQCLGCQPTPPVCARFARTRFARAGGSRRATMPPWTTRRSPWPCADARAPSSSLRRLAGTAT
jgi:hypothetical protein